MLWLLDASILRDESIHIMYMWSKLDIYRRLIIKNIDKFFLSPLIALELFVVRSEPSYI